MKKLWLLEVDVRLPGDQFPMVRYQFHGSSIDEVEAKCRQHAARDVLLREAINEDGYMVDTDYSPIGVNDLKLGGAS